MFLAGAACVLAAASLCSPTERPILSEIFYDQIGDDTGLEFVEFFNPLAIPMSLLGVRLEAGDGSGPGRWSLRWTGSASDSVVARGRFVVGGSRVAPPPQAVTDLQLQNGPDAVRLVWPDGAREVVGYGSHEFAEYACETPAADAPAGQSLARIPDGSDRGSNALDFSPSIPSPGRANLPERDAAVIGGSLAIDPEQPEPGAPARLIGTVMNLGSTVLSASDARVLVSDALPGGEQPLGTAVSEGALSPGDTARFELSLIGLGAGKHDLRARVDLLGDERPENDRDSLKVRVGPGPLEITEIQFHPDAGEGEWVEVRNRSASPIDLSGFRMADRLGSPGTPSGGESALVPDSLALLVQDRDALMARYPTLDGRRLWQVAPWPSLNNHDDSSGVADLVILREADGTPVSQSGYSAAGVPAGVPIEPRLGGGWWPTSDPSGTPLKPPRAPFPLAGSFEVSPRRLRTAGGAALMAWSLPWARGRVTVELYDLEGRRVAQLLPETSVAGRGERPWPAVELPSGLYLAVLRARSERGGETMVSSLPVRVESQ